MRVAVGFDHRGFLIRDDLIGLLKDAGHEIVDHGTDSDDSVDFPDLAAAVGRSIQSGEAERGIVVCGSGAGASIAANKLHGIRAAMAHDTYTAHQCVEHDDANVLCLGSMIVGLELLSEIVRAFLDARFQSDVERYRRRVAKIEALEACDD